MSQLAIYIDEELQKKMDQAAKSAGKSRSAFVKEAIIQKIGAGFPESWFALWGSWEDKRSTREILTDIDQGYSNHPRKPIR